MAVRINLKDVARLLALVSRSVEGMGTDIQLKTDAYKIIGADDWGDFTSEITPEVGSLKDDWESLQKLLVDKERPLTMVDLDRLSSILRAISEHFSPVPPS